MRHLFACRGSRKPSPAMGNKASQAPLKVVEEGSLDAATKAIAKLPDAALSKPVDDEGRTLLHVACGHDEAAHAEGIARLLVERGAKLEAKDRDGNTSLMVSVCCRGSDDKVGLVDFLIESGADVNAVNEAAAEGSTAITRASKYGSKAVVEALSDAGADIDAPDHSHMNWVPLHFAAEGGNLRTVEALIGLGAQTSIKDVSAGPQQRLPGRCSLRLPPVAVCCMCQ